MCIIPDETLCHPCTFSPLEEELCQPCIGSPVRAHVLFLVINLKKEANPLEVAAQVDAACYCLFTFSHFIDGMYWDRSGQKIPGCLSVCVSVCLCVCVSALVWRNYRNDFDETFQKWFSICLVVRVCVSAH